MRVRAAVEISPGVVLAVLGRIRPAILSSAETGGRIGRLRRTMARVRDGVRLGMRAIHVRQTLVRRS